MTGRLALDDIWTIHSGASSPSHKKTSGDETLQGAGSSFYPADNTGCSLFSVTMQLIHSRTSHVRHAFIWRGIITVFPPIHTSFLNILISCVYFGFIASGNAVVMRGLAWALPTDCPLAYCFKCFHLKQLKGVCCVPSSCTKINIAYLTLANQSRLGICIFTPRCCHTSKLGDWEYSIRPPRKEIYSNTIRSTADVTEKTISGWLSVSHRTGECSPAAWYEQSLCNGRSQRHFNHSDHLQQ